VRGLSGKVAAVVGGAGGIGTASCFRLADEGCAIAVGDLNGDAAQEVADRIKSSGDRCGRRLNHALTLVREISKRRITT
jgi:NAD(P)-dependent dehydrogenase (short-subunit alcohol dehydrogenase family)